MYKYYNLKCMGIKYERCRATRTNLGHELDIIEKLQIMRI